MGLVVGQGWLLCERLLGLETGWDGLDGRADDDAWCLVVHYFLLESWWQRIE